MSAAETRYVGACALKREADPHAHATFGPMSGMKAAKDASHVSDQPILAGESVFAGWQAVRRVLECCTVYSSKAVAFN